MPDPDTLTQLRAFAAERGPKTWKRDLTYYWMRGLPVPDFPLLYGLRNHPKFGPAWLKTFRLPRETA